MNWYYILKSPSNKLKLNVTRMSVLFVERVNSLLTVTVMEKMIKKNQVNQTQSSRRLLKVNICFLIVTLKIVMVT